MSDTSGKDRSWLEIAGAFLKRGAMGYGGAALMGLLQRELQEKRGWVSKEQFVEDLAVVNMLPGPRAQHLADIRRIPPGRRMGWHSGGAVFHPARVLQMVPKADPTHLPRCWGC